MLASMYILDIIATRELQLFLYWCKTYVTYILGMVATRELQFVLVEDPYDLHTGHEIIPPYE